jgi:hypothetical protein
MGDAPAGVTTPGVAAGASGATDEPGTLGLVDGFTSSDGDAGVVFLSGSMGTFQRKSFC